MKKSLALTLISLAVSGLCQTVMAGPERIDNSKDKFVAPTPVCDPRWYISIGGSVDPNLGSDFSNGFRDSFSFDNDNATNAVNGQTATIVDFDIRSRDWDEVYSNWWNVRAEFGYVLTSHIEIFGKFEYTRAEGNLLTGSVISVDQPRGIDFDLELLSRFDDYQSYGGELGIRYFFLNKEAAIRPYVSLSGGAAFVDSIGVRTETEIFGNNVSERFGFYDETIVPTVSALLGVEFRVLCNFYVGLDGGVKWTGELDDNDSSFDFVTTMPGLNGLSNSGNVQAILDGLRHLNDNGADRLSFPITVYAKFRF